MNAVRSHVEKEERIITMNEMIKYEEIEKKIITIRGQQVLIDRDVADLYGVETKRINEAVKNNPVKFPDGYIIALDGEEKAEVVENFDHLSVLKFSHVTATAFTEKGLYMLATILKSPAATQTTIAIVETFTKIRELSRTINLLPNVQEESAQKTLMQKSGELLADVLDDNTLKVSGDETTIELNLALLKIKHTVKRGKA